MPRAFCIGECNDLRLHRGRTRRAPSIPRPLTSHAIQAQPSLLGVSWTLMTALTSSLTLATSVAILRPAGGVPATPAFM